MAEEAEKKEEAKAEPGGKSNKGLVVVVLAAAVVLGGGAAAAGAIVAVKLAPSSAPAAAPAAEHSERPKKKSSAKRGEKEEPEKLATKEFAPIVVDLRAADGLTHHLKVNIAAEVPAEGEKKEKDEDKGMTLRGREAAIAYLRSLTYEQVMAPKSFEKIKEELSKQIIEAVGEEEVESILITDFVTQ